MVSTTLFPKEGGLVWKLVTLFSKEVAVVWKLADELCWKVLLAFKFKESPIWMICSNDFLALSKLSKTFCNSCFSAIKEVLISWLEVFVSAFAVNWLLEPPNW